MFLAKKILLLFWNNINFYSFSFGCLFWSYGTMEFTCRLMLFKTKSNRKKRVKYFIGLCGYHFVLPVFCAQTSQATSYKIPFLKKRESVVLAREYLALRNACFQQVLPIATRTLVNVESTLHNAKMLTRTFLRGARASLCVGGFKVLRWIKIVLFIAKVMGI